MFESNYYMSVNNNIICPNFKPSNAYARFLIWNITEMLDKMSQCLVTLRFAVEKGDVYKFIIVYQKCFFDLIPHSFRSGTLMITIQYGKNK